MNTTNTTIGAAIAASNEKHGTDSAQALPELKKWETGQGLGPRMAKAFNDAMRTAQTMSHSFVTKRGVKGVSEEMGGYMAYTFPPTCLNPLWQPGLAKIQADLGHVVTADNYRALVSRLGELEAQMQASPCVKDETITPEEHEKREKADAARREEDRKRQEKEEAAKAKVMAAKPAWASAAIIATYEEDACDMHSDYFSTTTKRNVIIGWRSGSKEDFRQLRAAARAYPETANLDNDEAEHRDNYSGGRGNYLKLGGRYSTGWYVHSVTLGGRWFVFGDCEICVPEPVQGAGQAAPVTSASGVTVSRNVAKGGVEIRFPAKPDEATINRVKAHGFRWSRFSGCWWAKATADKLAFAYGLAGQEVPQDAQGAAPAGQSEAVRDPGEDAADRWTDEQVQDRLLEMRTVCD